MPNPLDYVSKRDIEELGLTPAELATSYQPSSGGAYHARGVEGVGKTLVISHIYRYLIDSGLFNPSDAVGNLTFKGKYGRGFTTLKGIDLFNYLIEFAATLPRHKIIIVSEIDREFPARFFAGKDQTKIALSLWEMQKIDSYFLMDSHVGNSTDLIFHLASHYNLYPLYPDWNSQTMPVVVEDMLHKPLNSETGLLSYWIARDIIKTMLIYNRCETTVIGERTNKKNQTRHIAESDSELDALDELIELS